MEVEMGRLTDWLADTTAHTATLSFMQQKNRSSEQIEKCPLQSVAAALLTPVSLENNSYALSRSSTSLLSLASILCQFVRRCDVVFLLPQQQGVHGACAGISDNSSAAALHRLSPSTIIHTLYSPLRLPISHSYISSNFKSSVNFTTEYKNLCEACPQRHEGSEREKNLKRPAAFSTFVRLEVDINFNNNNNDDIYAA